MFNMDFTQRIVIDTDSAKWQPTSMPGVSRKLLAHDPEGGHLTAMVRYSAGSMHSRPEHSSGEEFLVLAGTFYDESGDYPTGTYCRVPPGAGHMPFVQQGCLLFVKLNQFQFSDNLSVCVNTKTKEWLPGQEDIEIMSLHEYSREQTALVKWPAGKRLQPQRHLGGEEIFVLSGEIIDDQGSYPPGTWIRSPQRSLLNLRTEKSTVAFVKVGHLPVDYS